MKALVFAAGLGTRLRPLTDTLPKALVPVGGKPLLYHVVSKLKDAGVDDLVINVHHFADSIEAYVHDQDDFGIKVSFSDERDLLRETGGGIRHARPFLEGGDFLVHNVDILSDLDVRWFVGQARPDALATILVSERRTSRYFLFEDGMRLAGWTNVATGEVRSPYGAIDPSRYRMLAFAGIHYICGKVFDIFEEDAWPEKFPIVDFYLRECAVHPIYGVVPDHLKLMDVGKLDSLDEADSFIATL